MAIDKITTPAIADDAVTNAKVSYNNNQFRNIIINGDMSIAQRATSVTGNTAGGYTTVDRWNTILTTAGTYSISQSSENPDGQGFAKSMKFDCTTADASLAAGDNLRLQTKFEGQNLQYLSKGTGVAKSLTLSFWVKSSKTGTYIVELEDKDNTRKISKSYTIIVVNTWEKKTITYEGDTTGAFNNDNNRSLDVMFWLAAGSTFSGGTTLNTSWGAPSTADRAVGQVNLSDSTSNEWYITGVQLEIGTSASDFEFLPVDVNLLRCQRYFQALHKGVSFHNVVFACYNSTMAYGSHLFPTTMRTAPSIVFNGLGGSDLIFYNNGNSRTLSAIAATNISQDGVSIKVTGSGWSGGQAAHMNNDDAATPFFTSDAEL